MLVYLDTSHLNMLEHLRLSDPIHFAWFIERWAAGKYILVLSLNHAQELAQLADETSRQRRLDVLGQLPRDRIRFSPRGSAGLLDIELLVEIRSLAGGRRMPLADIQRLLFGQRFDDFTSTVAENVKTSHKSFKFRTTAAEGLNELAKIKRDMETLAITHNLPKTYPTKVDFDWDRTEPLIESTLRTSVEDTPADRGLIEFVRHMNELVKKHKSVPRAFDELYGLRGMDITPPLHPTNRLTASVFFSSAQEQIKQVAEACNISLPSLLALLPKLHPYKTPGYSLGIAVDRARQLSGNRAEAGDQIDVDHITFAPYVDLLFVDKRTFTFLNQELRDRPGLLVPPPDGRIHFAGNVDQLEQALGL